jgi:cob(I)alamin adenosyltransferase
MANRLTRITTRTGDTGTTGLADGSRIGKEAPRIAALGDIDELNSLLGVILSEELPAAAHDLLIAIQHDLFDLGGELAMPSAGFLQDTQLTAIETAIERYNGELGPLKEFILPGGTRAAALAHLARAVCRRAERAIVLLGTVETVSAIARKYLNRLSDLLFVLGRWLNKAAGSSDMLWQKGRNAGTGSRQ